MGRTRYLVDAMVVERRSPSELARTHGVARGCPFRSFRTPDPAESGQVIRPKADTLGAERRHDVFGCQVRSAEAAVTSLRSIVVVGLGEVWATRNGLSKAGGQAGGKTSCQRSRN